MTRYSKEDYERILNDENFYTEFTKTGWTVQLIDDQPGVRNVALEIDTKVGYPHIAYTREDTSNPDKIDIYYTYWNGTGWNSTRILNDFVETYRDRGIALGLDPDNQHAFFPWAYAPKPPSQDGLYEYNWHAHTHYTYGYKQGQLQVTGTGVVGANSVQRNVLVNLTVSPTNTAGEYVVDVYYHPNGTSRWRLEKRLAVDSVRLRLQGYDKFETLFWESGQYKLVLKQLAQYVYEEVPGGNLTLTCVETNRTAFCLFDWGYRGSDLLNFSTYWEGIDPSKWEVQILIVKTYPPYNARSDMCPTEVVIPEDAFHAAPTLRFDLNGAEGTWHNEVHDRMSAYYLTSDMSLVACIKKKNAARREWTRSIMFYIPFTMYYRGVSGNVTISPSNPVENDIITINITVQGLEELVSLYRQDAVKITITSEDRSDMSPAQHVVPIAMGHATLRRTIAPAGEYRISLYILPATNKATPVLLDTRTFTVTTGTILGDFLLSQRIMLGTDVFNGMVAGIILLGLTFAAGAGTRSTAVVGGVLTLGALGFSLTGYFPMWVGGLVILLAGAMVGHGLRKTITG